MEVSIPFEKNKSLAGILDIPTHATGIVLFAHGSGSSRLSPRNQLVAAKLQQSGLATLLFDLLTPDEEVIDERTAELRFNIPFLAQRLLQATKWVQAHHPNLSIGYFGASTGAAAALVTAAKLQSVIRAVVSRGGRPDLAKDSLRKVTSPTLLIVGGWDTQVIALNEQALQDLTCTKKLEIVEGATHLFEENGKMQLVTQLALSWFKTYLT